jgi:hypothetical protein
MHTRDDGKTVQEKKNNKMVSQKILEVGEQGKNDGRNIKRAKERKHKNKENKTNTNPENGRKNTVQPVYNEIPRNPSNSFRLDSSSSQLTIPNICICRPLSLYGVGFLSHFWQECFFSDNFQEAEYGINIYENKNIKD